ncbi:efflux RND transporter permease subunit [Nitrosomonas communis]|uniref:Cobalt-zinc-cadmium resistance protein CzcA n=1 Tax=Nitrosomonas communis TaxID=44574 RepID=A0A1I4KKK3_9PROT|nr:CusA/CzcA family heavy metal efflux RND transporter [Nitrosomonas communis]SFL79103.1 cobalt-zinc-cadmium resistance protein CzcA [Nitrosomonas communis]
MMAAIVRAMLNQRLLVLVIGLALCIAGGFAAKNLSVDAFPDVTNIQVQVATVAIGRSPEEMERLVTVPVEIAMTGLPGLVEMRSMNKSGLSLITLVFTDETDVFFARQLVMERIIDVTPRLIRGITPVLGPVSTGLGEVYQYTIEHPNDGNRALTEEELTERRTIQDWVVRPMLRSIRGVAEINSIGGHVKEYQVYVDPNKLRHYDLTLTAVDRALASNNANASGNILALHYEQYLIRGVGLIATLDDIRNIILKEMDGVPIYVRDVAEVRFGGEVRQGASIKNGYTESVAGIVMMLRGGNAKEIVGRIKEKVAEINERGLLPGGLQIVPFYDRTDLVDGALATVQSTLVESLILVIVVLSIFLGTVRTSIVVCFTLIITPLVTFIVMNYYGLPANLMSLGGLTIALGMMVDPTVVVVENIYQRLGQAKGTDQSKFEIIVKAVAEVGTPVIFGVFVTILVFLPLMTLEGMEGKTFSPLAITIAISLLVALFVSVLLSPVLSDYLLTGGSEHDTKIVAALKHGYLHIFNLAMRNQKKTMIIAISSLIIAFSLFPLLGKSFIPIMKEGAVTPVIIRAPSISLEEAIELEMEAMQKIATIPGVKSVVSKLGRGESPADPASQNESDPIADLDLEGSGRTQAEIEEDIRKALADLPGVNIVLSQPIAQRVDEMVTGVRSQVAIKIFGDDLEELRKLSEQVARIVKSTRGARDIRIERLSGQQELTINIDRRAIARHGLNVSDVNELIATAIGGKAVTQVFEGERRFTLLLRFPEGFRHDVEAIKDLLLLRPASIAAPAAGARGGGMLIPLSAVADIQVVDGPAIISREFAKRRVVVGANVHERDMGGFVAELQERTAKEIKLPPGYYFVWGGQFENMERAMATLSVIVPVTLAAIFFLLFMLFNSVKLAGLIYLVLPFASVGGVVGLFVTGEYLSVPASVGFIAVWGTSILNGVVLISFIRELRDQGLSVEEAVRKACAQRFRPVMMTAATTVLGLAPFLVATGLGSEVQKPLAIVVVCGLTTATLMTMVVMPMLYRWFDDKPEHVTSTLASDQIRDYSTF